MSLTANSQLTVSNSTLTIGTVSGAYTLTKAGTGNLVLNATGNNPTGGLIISNGTVTIANNNAVGQFPLTVNSPGVLNFNNGQIFGVLNGNGTINENTNEIYTDGAANGIYSGTINGSGGYVKQSTGTEILWGLIPTAAGRRSRAARSNSPTPRRCLPRAR